MKVLFDVLLAAVWTTVVSTLVYRQQIRVILTVAHSYFLLTAFVTAELTGRPLIVIVHDDWVSLNWRGIIPVRRLYREFYGLVLRRAARVYAISPPMRDSLAKDYGVKAVLQMPSASVSVDDSSREFTFNASCPRVVYSGSALGTSDDGLDTLTKIIADGTLARWGLPCCEFVLYTNADAGSMRSRGMEWSNASIRVCGWLKQDALREALARADILFLPLSFRPDHLDLVRTSFPTKMGDYLAAGRPILMFAPEDSAVAQYARQHGFAEVVDHGTSGSLAEALARLASSFELRRAILENARRTLDLNHRLETQQRGFYDDVRLLAGPRKRLFPRSTGESD